MEVAERDGDSHWLAEIGMPRRSSSCGWEEGSEKVEGF